MGGREEESELSFQRPLNPVRSMGANVALKSEVPKWGRGSFILQVRALLFCATGSGFYQNLSRLPVFKNLEVSHKNLNSWLFLKNGRISGHLIGSVGGVYDS